MKQAKHIFFAIVISMATLAGCATGPYAQSGTLGGGLAGGAVGALAGAPSDRSIEGAAIGALAGGLIGNASGNMADQNTAINNARDNAYAYQLRSQAVTTQQVIQMSQNGLGENLIVNQMRNNGVTAPLTSNDMIALKQNGVSDRIIEAWQNTPTAGTPTSRIVRVPPVVVRPVYPGYHCPYDPCGW